MKRKSLQKYCGICYMNFDGCPKLFDCNCSTKCCIGCIISWV